MPPQITVLFEIRSTGATDHALGHQMSVVPTEVSHVRLVRAHLSALVSGARFVPRLCARADFAIVKS